MNPNLLHTSDPLKPKSKRHAINFRIMYNPQSDRVKLCDKEACQYELMKLRSIYKDNEDGSSDMIINDITKKYIQ